MKKAQIVLTTKTYSLYYKTLPEPYPTWRKVISQIVILSSLLVAQSGKGEKKKNTSEVQSNNTIKDLKYNHRITEHYPLPDTFFTITPRGLQGHNSQLQGKDLQETDTKEGRSSFRSPQTETKTWLLKEFKVSGICNYSKLNTIQSLARLTWHLTREVYLIQFLLFDTTHLVSNCITRHVKR